MAISCLLVTLGPRWKLGIHIREVLHVEIRIFFRNTAAQVENAVEDSETFSEKALFSERTFRQLSSVHDQGSCKIAVRFYDVTPAKHFVDS